MRLFLALDPDPATRSQLEHWRRIALPAAGRPVPPGNFHITLLFLGELSAQQAERLALELDRVAFEPFALTLDRPGYFPKPGLYWIGPSALPEQLAALVRSLKSRARKLGLRVDGRPYRPHLTLLRNCAGQLPAPSVSPAIACEFTGFTLFESVNGRNGVRYRPLADWSTAPGPAHNSAHDPAHATRP